ncbi:MAG: response regulator [Gammaproteobacteria bacterium]
MYRLMLVDDEPLMLKALKRVLATDGRDIETYTDPHAALRRLRTTPFDLILSDYRMPGMDGVQLLSAVRELQPESVRMVLSGYADLDAVMGAINEAGIVRFLSKPWQDHELQASVEHALLYRDMLMENRRLADQVRAQRRELQRLEELHPGLTRVDWGDDGSILIDETTYSGDA